MSTWPLVLMGLLFAGNAAEGVWGGRASPLPGWALVSLALGSKAGIGAAACWVGWRGGRSSATPRGIGRAEVALSRLKGALLVAFAIDLALGWLTWLREWMGDAVLLDELLAVLPTLVGWWAIALASWPIERRVRSARLIGELDRGESPSVGAGWGWGGAWAAAADRARHELAAVFVAVLAMLGWSEVVASVGWPPIDWLGGWAREAAVLGGAGVVLLAMPLVIRWTWRVRVLGSGALRDELVETLRGAGVRRPTILLWRAPGRVANAAVVGLVRGWRYVLVSEALVEGLTSAERRAVVAHEAGHVRHGHMAWLGVASAGLLLSGYAAGGALATWFEPADSPDTVWWASGTAIAAWVLGFGWVSRRIERQADADAVRLLSPSGAATAEGAAVDAMRSALERVAELNGVSPRRWTWRHGSIEQRRTALDRLRDMPLDGLPIDREVRRVRWVALAILIGGIAWLARGWA